MAKTTNARDEFKTYEQNLNVQDKLVEATNARLKVLEDIADYEDDLLELAQERLDLEEDLMQNAEDLARAKETENLAIQLGNKTEAARYKLKIKTASGRS